MDEWVGWVAIAVLTAVIVLLAITVRTLRQRIDALEVERPLVTQVAVPSEAEAPAYVVTDVVSTGSTSADSSTTDQPDRRIEGSLFADLVLRESLVRGVSLAYGVARALTPENRNRIRFQMRQEVKRSRRQRRVDLREARRHLAEMRRAGLRREDAA